MNTMSLPRYDAPYLAWNTVASYDNADEARAVVDRLADGGFPIENLDVVGSDLRTIDHVTGRVTRTRLARAGALSGMWTGLLVGLLLAIMAPAGATAGFLVAGIAVGAAAGAGLATVASPKTAHRLGGFASVRTLVAGRYDVVARNGFAEQARSALQQPPTATSL